MRILLALLLLVGQSHVTFAQKEHTTDRKDPLTPCMGKTPNSWLVSGASLNVHEIKPTAGRLLMLCAENTHPTSPAYLKCTDAPFSKTHPGTTPIFWRTLIPSNGGVIVGDANLQFHALTCYLSLYGNDRDRSMVSAQQIRYIAIYQ